MIHSYSSTVYIPDVGQHSRGRSLRLDRLDRLELVHVGNPIDYRVNPSRESTTMLQNTFTRPDLDLPSGVEKIGAWENRICMAEDDHRGHTGEGNESSAHKRRVKRHGRGQKDGHFSPADTMVPHVEGTIALEFAHNTVRGSGEVMGRLENVRNLLRNWDGKDE